MATTTARTPAPSRRLAPRLLAFLERERLVVAVVAAYATVALLAAPSLLRQDGWLALVSGRLIAHDGLPRHDTLTVWASGASWPDQQWLAQLSMYALHVAGGLRLLLLVHVALVVFALTVAMVTARRGASPLTVALVGVLALIPFGLIYLEVRTQAFGVALFAVVLALLLADARAPSRRVLLALPLLVAWANMHGSVVLGAGLVGLRGVTLAVPALRAGPRGEVVRGLVLMLGAVAAVFASPYAAEIPSYYRHTLANPQFATMIAEWAPTKPGLLTAPFYALLLLAAWTVGRRGHTLTTFEKLTLLVTGAGGLLAARNTGWLAVASLMILPRPLDAIIGARSERPGRVVRVAIACVPLLAVALAAVVTLARPARAVDHQYPAGPADVVVRVAAADPHARIFADLRFSDWLLWHHPELAGRIAFDARLELLTTDQLLVLKRFWYQMTDDWRRAVDGYDVVVLDRTTDPAPSEQPPTYRALLARGAFRIAYLSPATAVLVRTRR